MSRNPRPNSFRSSKDGARFRRLDGAEPLIDAAATYNMPELAPQHVNRRVRWAHGIFFTPVGAFATPATIEVDGYVAHWDALDAAGQREILDQVIGRRFAEALTPMFRALGAQIRQREREEREAKRALRRAELPLTLSTVKGEREAVKVLRGLQKRAEKLRAAGKSEDDVRNILRSALRQSGIAEVA